MIQSISKVYIAVIPDIITLKQVSLLERNLEIESCPDYQKKIQKYCVWKLFEYALKETFNCNTSDMDLIHLPNGKWYCKQCYFSLSHSDNVVMVGLSNTDIGVDIERVHSLKHDISNRIFNDEEKDFFKNKISKEKNLTFFEIWTKKESIFKRLDGQEKDFSKINVLKNKTITKKVIVNNKVFICSVASDNFKKITFKFLNYFKF